MENKKQLDLSQRDADCGREAIEALQKTVRDLREKKNSVPNKWEWLLQQNPPHFTIGDRILFEGKEMLLVDQIKQKNGWVESTWDEVK